MIEREFRGRVLFTAVLAGRVVPQQDVFPRERAAFERDVDVLRQANHGRGMNCEFLRMKDVAVVFFHTSYPLEDHHDSAPFGAHVDGLKGGI